MKTVDQEYTVRAVADLVTFPGNPRVGDLETITESVETNGFYGAILVQASTNRIVAGNHRYLAAVANGAVEVPVLLLDVDDDQAKRIVAVDNRSNDKAGYDDRLLLEFLSELGDLTGTGYDDRALSDLDKLLSVPPTPDEMGGVHGDPDDTLFFPEIKLRVSPDVFDRWRTALDAHAGKNDTEKFVKLLGEVEAAREGV